MLNTRAPLPNFLIVGAAKAGTTSLYMYLKQHPEVYMSPVKEPHFFSQVCPKQPSYKGKVVKDQREYLDLFRGAAGYSVAGEASPSYLWDKNAPYRIRNAIPNAKIIILLREPIARAYSHYLMDIRAGVQDNKSFYQALQIDYNKQEKGWGVSHLYVELGMYYEQISRYMEIFKPEQIQILLSDDLKTNTRESLKQVFSFLNISEAPLKSINYKNVHNKYILPRNKVISFFAGFSASRQLGNKLLSNEKRDIVKNILYQKPDKPELEKPAKDFLCEIYSKEIVKLRTMMNNSNLWHEI